MKKLTKSIIIIVLLMSSIPVSAKQESTITYYGLISNYPITMKLTYIQDGRVKGEYYYNKYKNKINLVGEYQNGEMKLYVKDKQGTVGEEFYCLWDDVEGEKSKYPGRIIGNWKKDQKELNFELRREEYTANKIDPFEDDLLEIVEMKVFQDLIFGKGVYVDLGTGCCSPTAVEYYNDLPVDDLTRIAAEIRSERWGMGSMFYALQRYYDFFFCEASLAPKLVSQHYWDISEDTLNYMKRWSLRSLYNFELYQEFMKEVEISKEKVYRYYIDKHNLADKDARRATNTVIGRIIDRAAGSYPGASTRYYELDLISPLLASVYNNDDLDTIKSLLQEEDNYESKLEALRATILLDRPLEMTKVIVSHIEDINKKPEGSYSCQESLLSLAANDYEKTKLLLKLDADPNLENDFGKTPLFYAIQYGDVEVVKLLVENGADVNHQYMSSDEIDPYEYDIAHGKRIPLMHAAQHSNVDMLEYLLKKGADLEAIDEVGDNAMDYAIRGVKPDNIKFLVRAGADINRKDEEGKTTLMYTVNDGRDVEVVKALLEAGAKLDLKDKNGYTALDYAKNRYNSELEKLLVEAIEDSEI